MSAKGGVRADEGLLMMQELDDRLKEQIDKLEHLRLASTELKDSYEVRYYKVDSKPDLKT